jgi:hypothetical protein
MFKQEERIFEQRKIQLCCPFIAKVLFFVEWQKLAEADFS